MVYLILKLYVINLLILYVLSQGKVNIGKTVNDNTLTYTFSFNYIGNAALNIPITIYTTDNSAISEMVNVSCQVSSPLPTVSPYTQIEFQNPVVLSSSVITGNVKFTVTQSGRPIQVTCYGVSVRGTQFQTSSSISVARTLTVNSPAIVGICQPTVVIANQAASLNLPVKLSEALVGNNVTVTCKTINNLDPNVLSLTFSSLAVLVGSGLSQLQVPYQFDGKGSVSAQVQCNAASDSGGLQYVSSTSGSLITTISLAKGSISFVQSSILTTSTSVTLYVTLDAALSDNQLILITAVQQVFSASEAEIVRSSPLCNATYSDQGNTTSTWSLDQSRIEFTTSTTQDTPPQRPIHQLVLKRNSLVNSSVSEWLIVSACVPSGYGTLKYPDKTSATAQVVAQLEPLTRNASLVNITTASSLPNPAYQNMAPCPCDLTSNQCDTSCCCDSDCSTDDKRLFTCYQGLFGGLDQPAFQLRFCSVNQSDVLSLPDYHTLLCVFSEQNAWLGLYSATQTSLTDLASFKSSYTTPLYSSTISGTRTLIEPNVTSAMYLQGNALLLVSPSSILTVEASNRLVFPQHTLTGHCEREAALTFLEESSATCDVTVSEALCTSNTILSARSYAMSTFAQFPACSSYSNIRAQGSNSAVLSVSANYYCPSSISRWVRSTSSRTSITPAQAGFFNQNCAYTNSAVDMSVTCVNKTAWQEPPSDPLCYWDDMLHLPPEPQISGSFCSNVLMGLKYTFKWAGPALVALQVDGILGNLSIGSVLSQSFQVSYMHNSTNSSSTKRSGLVGYDEGAPIIGAKVINQTGSTFNVNRSYTYQPYIYKAASDGLCSNAQRQEIRFLKSATSSCYVYFRLSDFDDCTYLAQMIKTQLLRLVPNDVVAVYGDPSSSDSNDWATVIKSFVDAAVPVNYTVTNVTDIANVTRANLTLRDGTKGFCDGLPNGIALDFFYAKQGLARYQPIWSIVGAAVKLQTTAWSFQCTAGSGSSCKSQMQPYSLTSVVRWVRVPPKWLTSPNAGYDEVGRTVCWWDICYWEMWYPFTVEFLGDNQLFSLGAGLVSIFVTIFVYLVSRPWW